MKTVKLYARDDFSLVDFFGEEYSIAAGDEITAKIVGRIPNVDRDMYSIPFNGRSSGLYDYEFVEKFFEIVEITEDEIDIEYIKKTMEILKGYNELSDMKAKACLD